MKLLLFCRNCISALIEKVQIQIFFATQQAANKWLGYKFFAPLFGGAFLYIGDKLNTGNFYFIKDEYYNRFPNCGLMGNKDSRECMEDHVVIVLKWMDIYGWFPYHLKQKNTRDYMRRRKTDIRNMMVYDLDI